MANNANLQTNRESRSSGGTNRGGTFKEEIKKGEPTGGVWEFWGNQRGRYP